MQQAEGRGRGYFTAEGTPPENSFLFEFLAENSVYVAGYFGAKKLSEYNLGQGKNTAYDLVQKQIRNTFNTLPFTFGVLNTFRIPEFMSPYMSTRGLGLTVEDSVDSANKGRIGQYTFQQKHFSNNETKVALREILGKDAYSKLANKIDIPTVDINHDLRYEQALDETGRGKLFLRSFNAQKELIHQELISDEVMLMFRGYNADAYDILTSADVEQKPNPANVAVQQGLEIPSKLPEKEGALNKIFAEVNEHGRVTSAAKFSLIPSVGGSLENLSDLKRRTAYLTSYLNFGFNRFNRLLSATADQVPVLGDFIGKVADKLHLNLRTTPGPAYKQFFSLGAKATAISAAYLGLETVDHYRRKFETPGHLAISGALAFGASKLYSSVSDSATRKFKPLQVGIAAFGMQMLPGFSEGLVPGIATMATSLDVGRSYLGIGTGMSFYRRGIEGLLPGFTDPSIGVGVGLAAVGLAYSNVLRDRLLDEKSKPILPKKFLNRYGFMQVPDLTTGTMIDMYRNKKGLIIGGDKATEHFNLLKEIFFETDSELFEKYNPLFGSSFQNQDKIEGLSDIQAKIRESNQKIRLLNEAIIKTKPEDVERQLQLHLELDVLNKQKEEVLKNSSVFKRYSELLNEKVGTFSTVEKGNDQKEKLLKNFFNILEKEFFSKDDDITARSRRLDFDNEIHNLIKTRVYESENTRNFLNYSLLNRVETIKASYKNSHNIFAPLLERIEIFGTEFYHAMQGATMQGDEFDTLARSIDYTPFFRRLGTVFAGGFLIHSVLSGNLLGTMENPGELKEIYSGNKFVDVRKGRFWEGGGLPYEGSDVLYSRPHAYHLLMTRAEEKSVWGEEDEQYNPISKWFLKNFTYHLEEKHFYDRPYPITGVAFENVPVLGSLLAHTVGRLIKPAKIMHANEYMRVNDNNQLEYYYPPEVGTTREVGQTTPNGPPISPYDGRLLAGKMQYQFRELEGLTGWVKNMIQKTVTGREIYGTDYPVLASANQMDSSIASFWDKDLGGMMFMSEALRRLYPRARKEVEQYNPISNTMPSWMPDKFRRGDPYTKIQNAYARLPGKGFEAVFPVLEGFEPEDYPDIFKYKILADVDPTSREVVKLRNQLYERRAAGVTSEYENKMMDVVAESHAKVIGMQEFKGYENQIKIPGVSDLTQTGYYQLKEGIRTIAQPIESVVPFGFRPAQKLLGGERDAIDQYEYERLYGTQLAFWDKPIRDWVRPAFYSGLNALGWEGKPSYVQDREALSKQYDQLNFYKFMNLSQQAGSMYEKKQMMAQAAKTRTGVNPYGDPLSIYMSLPSEEKKFFDAFANAQGSERDRILEMIPEDQQHLYQGLWSNLDAGIDPSSLIEEKPRYDESYLQEQYSNLDMGDYPMPEPDWVGWNKEVDINDIKVNYVSSLGSEMRDYDLWDSQVRRVKRHHALTKAHEFMYEDSFSNRGLVNSLLKYSNPYQRLTDEFSVNTTSDFQNRTQLIYNDDRQNEINALVNSFRSGY